VLLVEIEGLDRGETDHVMRALRRDLLATTDVAGADLRCEAPPEGTRGAGDIATQIALQVTGSTMAAVVGFISAWLSQRRKTCSILYTLPSGAQVRLPSVELDQLENQLPPELQELFDANGE
jgi:hypothetical protein